MTDLYVYSSHIQLFLALWTVACKAPLSMEFSRQGYWNGEPFPSPGEFLDPRIKPRSPVSQADSLQSEPSGKPVTGYTGLIQRENLHIQTHIQGECQVGIKAEIGVMPSTSQNMPKTATKLPEARGEAGHRNSPTAL